MARRHNKMCMLCQAGDFTFCLSVCQLVLGCPGYGNRKFHTQTSAVEALSNEQLLSLAISATARH